MALKSWYKVVTPREDLREGKPLDASEFAVHLDQVRTGSAAAVYQEPQRFFERTYLTRNLIALAAEVVRRLSGELTETSAVFNMTTQFGGGKTHALTLLYHLAENGPKASSCSGVSILLEKAGVPSIPRAKTAVFVGQKFDPRGGDDGTPLRKTPWGEIAWQLAGDAGFRLVESFDNDGISPGGDTIGKLFKLVNEPILILMDELMNYVSRYRKSGLGNQLYNFLHNLSEEARSHRNVVLAVSIPASELEMTAEDHSDYERFMKLLDRLGKAVMLSAEAETGEIIRRRLFEWNELSNSPDGLVVLPRDAYKTCEAYADWVIEHRQQLPGWFPIDNARDAFAVTYPFHPTVLSVFERKWQTLPRFQQTRGILQLLALWVSNAYQEGYKGAHSDALISLGTAPIEDPMFRSAMFEQLGETRLEGVVTTDICGKKDSHAVRLDKEAVDTIRKARLHRKVATTIFFESNGGQSQDYSTTPEIQMAVAAPDLDITNVETVLDALDGSCYYLHADRKRYWFTIKPTLNKILADRRAGIAQKMIEERVQSEIQDVFAKGPNVERVFFPEKSSQIPDRHTLTLVILSPNHSMQDMTETQRLVNSMTQEYGTSHRSFKSALIWCVPESVSTMNEEARKLLAWESIQEDQYEGRLSLDEAGKNQLLENLKKAQRDLRESVWRTYKTIMLLDRDNSMRTVDMGLVHSSAADSLIKLILNQLSRSDDVKDSITPNFLVRNWPPAFREWSIKSVRDAFFASPQFPRLLNADVVKETIAKGVTNNILAYVGKTSKEDGSYNPFIYKTELNATDVEISEDMFIITAEEAEKHIQPPELTMLLVSPQNTQVEIGKKQTFTVRGLDQHGDEIKVGDVQWSATGGEIEENGVLLAGQDEGSFIVKATVGEVSSSASYFIRKGGVIPPPPSPKPGKTRLSWTGEIPAQKWMNFYTKVLARFAVGKELRIRLSMEVSEDGGVSPQAAEETKSALRELGLDDDVKIE